MDEIVHKSKRIANILNDLIWSAKDLASFFYEIGWQYIDLDGDVTQFENIEDNVNLFEIQEVDQSVIMSINELPTKYSKDAYIILTVDQIFFRIIMGGGGALVKPLTHLINLSIKTGQFSGGWKKALVKLIFNSENDQLRTN